MMTTYDEAMGLVAQWNRAKAVVATAERTRRSFPEVWRRAKAEADYLESISKGALEAFVAENEDGLADDEQHWVDVWLGHGKRRLAMVEHKKALAGAIEKQAGVPLSTKGRLEIEAMPDREVAAIFVRAEKAAKAGETAMKTSEARAWND